MKLDVEKNLPPKEEIIVDVELTNLQKGCVRDAVCACMRVCACVCAYGWVRVRVRACVSVCSRARAGGRKHHSVPSALPPRTVRSIPRSRMWHSEHSRLLARRYYRAIYERNREFLTTSVGGAFGFNRIARLCMHDAFERPPSRATPFRWVFVSMFFCVRVWSRVFVCVSACLFLTLMGRLLAAGKSLPQLLNVQMQLRK